MTLPIYTDTGRTLAEFRMAQGLGPILKHPADLARYERIIEATAPEVIVECGTNAGASAAWFANRGLDVITIDINPRHGDRAILAARDPEAVRRITYVVGSSIDLDTYGRVAELVDGRRCMVSLDSDHAATHVTREIEIYGPLVTPGCYLVVEDTIFRFAPPEKWKRHHFGDPARGDPMDAVEATLADNPGWRRDVDIERLDPISHHPAGFWVRL